MSDSNPRAVVGGNQPPIEAWHGTPYDFDKFLKEKIGTGEGAQVYGHGLYFAEKKGIAQHYRDAVTRQQASQTNSLGRINNVPLLEWMEHMDGLHGSTRGKAREAQLSDDLFQDINYDQSHKNALHSVLYTALHGDMSVPDAYNHALDYHKMPDSDEDKEMLETLRDLKPVIDKHESDDQGWHYKGQKIRGNHPLAGKDDQGREIDPWHPDWAKNSVLGILKDARLPGSLDDFRNRVKRDYHQNKLENDIPEKGPEGGLYHEWSEPHQAYVLKTKKDDKRWHVLSPIDTEQDAQAFADNPNDHLAVLRHQKQDSESIINWIDQNKGDLEYKDPGGRLYNVNIHAGDHDLLDWDEFTGKLDPEHRKIIRRAYKRAIGGQDFPDDEDRGQELYHDLVKFHGSPAAASEALLKEGIKGIRYRDAGSRRPDDQHRPSYNYVVFDPQFVQIMKKFDKNNQLIADYGVHLKEVDHDPFAEDNK